MAKVITKNKRAFFDYEMLDNFEAGIVLEGWEIKSIRKNEVTLLGAFCSFRGDELFINNMNISNFMGNPGERTKARKLLLKKNELKKIRQTIEQKGLTVVPKTLKISSKGLAKLDIAIARGKTTVDKRHTIKARDQERINKSLLKGM